MIYKVLHEFNLSEGIDGFKLNVSDARLKHDRRVKIVGKGVNKGKGTSIPVHNKISTFDELIGDKHSNSDRNNETTKYIGFVAGFIIMNHDKFMNYFKSVDNDSANITQTRQALDNAFSSYKRKYKVNDIARIRKDANSHALSIRKSYEK